VLEKHKKWLSAYLLASLLCLAGLPNNSFNSIRAAENGEDSGLFELPLEQAMNIEVTSVTRTKGQDLFTSPAAIYVITQEDIQRSGLRSIPEILRLAPGVQVSRIRADQWAISVRGFNERFSDKLLVQIDGRTIYNMVFSGVLWEVQDYVLEDIERIEVIRGSGASLWGANAVHGIINIITKKAKDTQG
jgi:iron complex outermembrane receptor protein